LATNSPSRFAWRQPASFQKSHFKAKWAQGGALVVAAGDVAVRQAHADAVTVEQDAGGVLWIVEEQQAGGAAGATSTSISTV
jgi:hypothetical protein